MSLSNIWINTIFKIATGGKLLRYIMTPVGGILFFSLIIGLVLLSLFLDKAFEYNDYISFPLDLIFGFVFLFPGIILMGSCVVYFFKNKGTPVPLNPPPVLINDGPYAYSRNPMLTGLFIILFGIGFICNSITLTFILTPIFILFNIIELKNIEEPELEKRLGEEYVGYRNKTPMFIPKINSIISKK